MACPEELALSLHPQQRLVLQPLAMNHVQLSKISESCPIIKDLWIMSDSQRPLNHVWFSKTKTSESCPTFTGHSIHIWCVDGFCQSQRSVFIESESERSRSVRCPKLPLRLNAASSFAIIASALTWNFYCIWHVCCMSWMWCTKCANYTKEATSS